MHLSPQSLDSSAGLLTEHPPPNGPHPFPSMNHSSDAAAACPSTVRAVRWEPAAVAPPLAPIPSPVPYHTTDVRDVPKAAVKPTREARRRRTAFILVSGKARSETQWFRAGDGCDARSQRPALEKDTRYPLVVCLLPTRETAFLSPPSDQWAQNVVTNRAVTMRIATLCCLIAGASAFGTLECISCWDDGLRSAGERVHVRPAATGEVSSLLRTSEDVSVGTSGDSGRAG